MGSVRVTREIDLRALPFSATLRWVDGEGEVEADVSDAELQAAVDDCPTLTEAPDPQEELRAAIESATTLPQLKDALLGKGRNVEVGGKPK